MSVRSAPLSDRLSFHLAVRRQARLMGALLAQYSWQELRQNPWRNAAAVVAVLLGVALAFSVHLINGSAIDEFAQAARSVGGQPDFELRHSGPSEALDESLLGALARHPDVALAAPVLELSTYALTSETSAAQSAKRVLVRVLGIDPLISAALTPDLLPLPSAGADRLSMLAPATVFLNATAHQRLGNQGVSLQQGMALLPVQVAGQVRAGGPPLMVMDIGAMQDLFGRTGITRVDLRLRSGVDPAAFRASLMAAPYWPPGATLAAPGAAEQRIDKISRAYRVNLTVLALIALFTGAFLVFSVLALSVARRTQQLALLAVLGLTGVQRLSLVLLEALVLGVLGSALGIALGTALAATALQWLGGDLGGGFFAGSRPALQWSLGAALLYFTLGVAAALIGAWWPARLAQRLPPAPTLKGLGTTLGGNSHAGLGAVLLLAGVLLAFLPPVAGVPLAAYISVGLLLVGGIAALPWLVALVLDRLAPWSARNALSLLAVERARRVRESAAIAVSGVVASLSLAVALTVMVSSFRTSVSEWLDSVLPASMYVRISGSGSANDMAYFEPSFVEALAALPGVERVLPQRTIALNLAPERPTVALMVRTLRDAGPGARVQAGDEKALNENALNEKTLVGLPLKDAALPVPPGRIGIYVSEAMLDLYDLQPGQGFAALDRLLDRPNAPLAADAPAPPGKAQEHSRFFVAGVWRDYSRQFGTIAMDAQDYALFNTDRRANDLAIWSTPGIDATALEQAIRNLADERPDKKPDPNAPTKADSKTDTPPTPNASSSASGAPTSALLEISSTEQLRAISLNIFDRSFAVTYWLQAVAIGIGLFGVAASFSAQVLARRKEFGLLLHLGLTRRQVLRVVAAEGAAWTSLGALAGLGLGLAVAVVLVHVVNPQSFHWTMELTLPWLRLWALAAGVVLAGTLTARISAKSAAGRDAVLAVKEDW